MDFIKKHFEKVLLALALLILIGVAAFLAFHISSLSEEIRQGAFRPKAVTKVMDRVPTDIFTNAIAGLENPSLWQTNSIDPFDTGTKYPSLVVSNPVPDNGPKEPFTLMAIRYTPFQLMFMSYTGNGEDIAINFLTKHRSFLGLKVGDEIKDQFGGTGYFIKHFDPKEMVVNIPGIGLRTNDVSELTIQLGNNNPVLLVLNTIAVEKEPQAVMLCAADMNNKELRVHKGQTVICGGKAYKVVDINSTQVIILDEANEQHIIYLPGAKE